MSKVALSKFLSKFPDNTKFWSEATDEIREIAKAARENYNEFENKKIKPLDFRTLRTPSQWNTKGKNYIFKVYDKMGEKSKSHFNKYLNEHFGVK